MTTAGAEATGAIGATRLGELRESATRIREHVADMCAGPEEAISAARTRPPTS